MSTHRVIVSDGGEYTGETYIRCYTCEITFNEGHLGLDALLVFLRDHEVIEGGTPIVAEPGAKR